MNLKRQQDNSKELSQIINLIPMINLIFLLLIFFLLTGVISKKDSGSIVFPTSEFGVKKEFTKNEITFLIDSNNQLFFKNKKIDIQEVAEIITDKEIRYIIEIDEKSAISEFNKLINEMKENNIKKVFFRVSLPKKDD